MEELLNRELRGGERKWGGITKADVEDFEMGDGAIYQFISSRIAEGCTIRVAIDHMLVKKPKAEPAEQKRNIKSERKRRNQPPQEAPQEAPEEESA